MLSWANSYGAAHFVFWLHFLMGITLGLITWFVDGSLSGGLLLFALSVCMGLSFAFLIWARLRAHEWLDRRWKSQDASSGNDDTIRDFL